MQYSLNENFRDPIKLGQARDMGIKSVLETYLSFSGSAARFTESL